MRSLNSLVALLVTVFAVMFAHTAKAENSSGGFNLPTLSGSWFIDENEDTDYSIISIQLSSHVYKITSASTYLSTVYEVPELINIYIDLEGIKAPGVTPVMHTTSTIRYEGYDMRASTMLNNYPYGNSTSNTSYAFMEISPFNIYSAGASLQEWYSEFDNYEHFRYSMELRAESQLGDASAFNGFGTSAHVPEPASFISAASALLFMTRKRH